MHGFFILKAVGILSPCLLVFITRAQFKNNTACSSPSFDAVTIYHLYQPGTTFGVGAETGQWHGQEDSRFSCFFGMYLLQYAFTYKQTKGSTYASAANIGLYAKGQIRIADHFYIMASPEFVNFRSFEFRTALRFIFNVGQNIGIGFEPGYTIVDKSYSVATNIHFAL